MSEQRIPLLVAAGGVLCLLLQLVVSLTENPIGKARKASQDTAYQSVKLRAEKRAGRLSPRVAQALLDGKQQVMQSELLLAAQADPEIVEIGIVDHDPELTVIASSEPQKTSKPLSGSVARVVGDSLGAGKVPLAVESRTEQRIYVAQPLTSQKSATLYLELNTAIVESDLARIVAAMHAPKVPAWLLIGIGLAGLAGALVMLLNNLRRAAEEALRVQEVVEQLAMGQLEARLDPSDVPHLAGTAERLNSLAEQVQLLQQAQQQDSEHASRIEQELASAAVVQQTLMPEVRRIGNGPLQLCGVYRSASKLSGDWWNHFTLDEHRTMLVLADVVGHGIGPAVVGAMAYGCATQLYQEQQGRLRPEALLSRLNDTIWASTKGKFTMSCFAVIIDLQEGKLTFASGAQAFPLLYRSRDAQKPFIPLVAAGSPLGSSKDAKFEAVTQNFEPGDMLICYTDGLTEAESPTGDPFSDKRVRQVIGRSLGMNVEEICEAVLKEAAQFVGTAELVVDQTLVVARRTAITS